MNKQLNQVKMLLKKGDVKQAKQVFEQITDKNNVDYLLVGGMLEQKFQNWSNAINFYNKVLEKDQDNKIAKNSIDYIYSIFNFRNSESLNV